MDTSDTLVLSGARIIDGTGTEPVRGRSVVVEKGVITAVVEDARAPRGNGVDLAGHTLLPGLINCHVHLCFGRGGRSGAAAARGARWRSPPSRRCCARVRRRAPG